MNTLPHIVIFGGSFNPPTVAHSLIVSYLVSYFPEPTQIWVMPVAQHAHAKDMIAFERRHRMVMRAMAQFDPRRVKVSNFEQLYTPANTFEMLTKMRELYPRTTFSFVVGADCYRDRATWHRWDDLQQLARFIVLGREGVKLEGNQDILVPLSFPDVSSTLVRELIAAGDISQAMLFIDCENAEECGRYYGPMP